MANDLGRLWYLAVSQNKEWSDEGGGRGVGRTQGVTRLAQKWVELMSEGQSKRQEPEAIRVDNYRPISASPLWPFSVLF